MPSTVFDRLKGRVTDQRKEQAQQWYAQQPRPSPVMPPPVIIRSRPQPTPPVEEQPVMEVSRPVHRTHKPLLVALISIVVAGAIVSLILFGPKFVGQAIAGVPELKPGMAGTYFAAPPPVVGQRAIATVGVYPSEDSYGFEVPVSLTEQLQLIDVDGDGAVTAADFSFGRELDGWRIDVDASQAGMVMIRGYHPQLQLITGMISIGVPIQVLAAGGRVSVQDVKMGSPDPLIREYANQAVVDAGGVAKVAKRRISRQLPSQPQLPQAQAGEKKPAEGAGLPYAGWSPKDYATFTGKSLEQLKREGKEICGDGFDNDGDGKQDCADTDADDCLTYFKCLAGDDDGDGVPNGVDRCAGSSAEDVLKELIGADGCPRGAGGDTCINERDMEKVMASVLPNGICSTDADNDSTADAQDDDVDGDGQTNVQDADDDNDGVEDTADSCPFTPLGKQVTVDGCLYGDVWDSTKGEHGRDGCVNGDDLDIIGEKVKGEFAC